LELLYLMVQGRHPYTGTNGKGTGYRGSTGKCLLAGNVRSHMIVGGFTGVGDGCRHSKAATGSHSSEGEVLLVFFAPAKYKVVKITCSNSEVVS
jgi:hypothetical protein